MDNGHTRPRDVSGDSCLTVSNTLVTYHVSHIYCASCPRCIPNTLVSYHVSHIYIVPRVHGVSPTHSFCIRCISFQQLQSVPISSNQLQLIATDTPNTLYITSPHYSNEASSLTFCTHPHYLISLISFK